jgi:serine/threonine protein kinase
VLQVLQSLAFLHSLGLVHSDLKPENILIKSYSRCEDIFMGTLVAGSPLPCMLLKPIDRFRTTMHLFLYLSNCQ